jgi:hypothetical protein
MPWDCRSLHGIFASLQSWAESQPLLDLVADAELIRLRGAAEVLVHCPVAVGSTPDQRRQHPLIDDAA